MTPTEEQRRHTSRLPAEVILQIGQILFLSLPTTSSSSSSSSHLSHFPSYRHTHSPSHSHSQPHWLHPAFSTLVSLSSVSRSVRALLAPLLWYTVHVTRPERPGRLKEILEFYEDGEEEEEIEFEIERSSLSSISPSDPSHPRPPSTWPSSPLVHIRAFRLHLPPRYMHFDRSALESLIRRAPNIASFHWDAEEMPREQTWRSLARSGALSELWVDCKTFWAGHPALSLLTSLTTLTLTTYDAHLSPPFLPSLLLSNTLRSLTLSTSKSSILHNPLLISSSVFSNLIELDVYPVTPETPLDEALASAGASLKRLKICFDVDGKLVNYDRLWKRLEGKMVALQVLHVDPHPQQNTAPSFAEFVRSCPALEIINDRHLAGLPPCFSLFTPDEPSGALAY